MALGLGADSTIALIGLMVAPLYAMSGWALFRLGKLMEAKDTADVNSKRLQSVERSVAEVEREMKYMKKDHETIHDLVADQNHCGAESCRFCDSD